MTKEKLAESVEKFKKTSRKQTIKEHEINENEEIILEDALKAAKMPVKLTNEEFELGDYELDIRNLNSRNYKQMMFRQGALNVVYLRTIAQNQVDIMRLEMLILKKLGVEDIQKATEDLLTELQDKVERKKAGN